MPKYSPISSNGHHPHLHPHPIPSPSPPPSKARPWPGILIGIIVLLILGSIAVVFLRGGLSTSDIFPSGIPTIGIFGTEVQTTTISQNNPIGLPVVVNKEWTVTLNSVTISNGNKLDQPTPEHTYVVVLLTLQNTSTRILTASSTHMFDIKDAHTGQTYQQNTSFGQSPDGTVASNGFITGRVAYEVPAGHHTFTLQFAPDVNGSVLAEWNLMI